jgi:hypothetical protein
MSQAPQVKPLHLYRFHVAPSLIWLFDFGCPILAVGSIRDDSATASFSFASA